MQQAQQRELPERISWARAMIFGVGFFLIAAILIGQLPSFVYLQATASTLDGLERLTSGLGVICLAAFAIIQVIVLLFDPKPVIPPIIVTVLGAILAVGGFALAAWAFVTANQYFPTTGTVFVPLLEGKVLWFEANAFDFEMLGLTVLGVGLAWVFYSILALREQKDPDRRDLGATPATRWMLVASILMLIVFMVASTYVNDEGLAQNLFGKNPNGLRYVDLVICIFLGIAILLACGAFALRLHYLMRPVRKRTMSGLYGVGALGFAQFGAMMLVAWILVYPVLAWMHSWTLIGLGSFLTICAQKTLVPSSCSFSPDAGYIFDGIVTMNFFVVLVGAIWAWRSHRNLVVIGSLVTVAVIGAATLLIHAAPVTDLKYGMMLCIGMLVLAGIWTIVARREFAVVGENNLGCLGQWLVVGTCLFIYLSAFAFFSIPTFSTTGETEPNIPYTAGLVVPPPTPAGQAPIFVQADAVVMMVVLGLLAGIQFYFLVRNRYKV